MRAFFKIVFLLIVGACFLQADPVTTHGTLKLVHAKATQTSALVKIKIQEPAEDQILAGPDVIIRFETENWELQENGNHLHFLLDQDPYETHSSKEPFVFHNVEPGPHILRVFPAYAWHESVKQQGALAVVRFYVKQKTGPAPPDPDSQLMIYNAPVSVHEANERIAGQPYPGVLIDWFLHNVTMGSRTGYFVRISVDGKPLVSMKEWRPHYLQNLSAGEHKIKLELTKNGAPVTQNWNSVERTITVKVGGIHQ